MISRKKTKVHKPDSSSCSEDVFDLTELAEKHASRVPFRMKVVNGFMATGNMKDPTFVVDEIYSVHLVKKTQVVKTQCDGKEYFIPVNSSAKFGIIQDERKECRQFASISELSSSKSLPALAAVLEDYTDNNRAVVLRKNDILALKKEKSSKRSMGKRQIHAYNISNPNAISLQTDMNIKLGTNPALTQLYLTELMDHTDLPVHCKIFSDCSSLSSISSASRLQLLAVETQKSVLVSLFQSNPNSKRKKETTYIEIPTRINISVSIVQESKEEMQVYKQIMEESRELLHCYNSVKIQPCMDSENDDDYITQAQLLAEVRKEKEKISLAKMAPEHYDDILSSSKMAKCSSSVTDRTSHSKVYLYTYVYSNCCGYTVSEN